MKKGNNKKIKSLLLALVYSVYLMLNCSSSANVNEKAEQVFIGSLEEVEEIYNPESEYLAYIVDERCKSNPNVKIYDSYLITNHRDMRLVIKAILELEEKEPTQWDRSYNSLFKEWLIHNLFHSLNILEERSRTVDFENSEEELYTHILSSLLNGKFDDDFAQVKDEKELLLK